MNTKQCFQCKEILLLELFYRNKRTKDGFAVYCKKCSAKKRGHSYTPQELWEDGHRACTKCKQIKPFSEFHKTKKGRFGLSSVCKPCKSSAKPKPKVQNGYKFCYKCGAEKPFTAEYFRRSSQNKSGLASLCCECSRQEAKDWRKQKLQQDPDYTKKMYWKHADKHRKRARAYYYANLSKRKRYNKRRYWENRDEELQKAREYYLQNSEAEKERSRQWRQDNPERYRQYNRQWIDDNPELSRKMMQAAWQRRRARKKNLPHDLTLEEWQYCLNYWNYSCVVCGDDGTINADHWIALSNKDCPGTVVDNMIPLCENCNKTKHATQAERWLTEKLGDHLAIEKLVEVEAYFEHVVSYFNNQQE